MLFNKNSNTRKIKNKIKKYRHMHKKMNIKIKIRNDKKIKKEIKTIIIKTRYKIYGSFLLKYKALYALLLETSYENSKIRLVF